MQKKKEKEKEKRRRNNKILRIIFSHFIINRENVW
jgi:hypothetical protein